MNSSEDLIKLLQQRVDGYEHEKLVNLNGHKEKQWCDHPKHSEFLYTTEYRIKKPTRMIGDIEVPDCLRVEPKNNERVWFVNVLSRFFIFEEFWVSDEEFKSRLRLGLAFRTREDAQKNLNALLSITRIAK